MRASSTTRAWAMVLAVVGLSACAASSAHAQGGPVPITWDHYWVYRAEAGFPPVGALVTLTDQFETNDHEILQLSAFMNPAIKTHGAASYPITNPDLHYNWWWIDPHPFLRPGVIVDNQFGQQVLDVSRRTSC